MEKVEFLVMFQKPDGSEYHWKWYKTFGGARRFVEYHYNAWGFRHGHNFNGWAIERRVSCGMKFTQRTAILAQSLSWAGASGIRRERLITGCLESEAA